MPTYSTYSFEELRLADYDNGDIPCNVSGDPIGCFRSGRYGSEWTFTAAFLPKSSKLQSGTNVIRPLPAKQLK
jgi:hypothetical protein